MGAFLTRRLLTILPTLLFVTILIFGLQQLLPGDPAIVLAGEERDLGVVAYLRAKMHLDEPLPVRYAYWLGGVARGDLGESLRMQQPVTALIAEKLPVTLELALLAIVIALVIGIPAGIVSAIAKGTWWDYAANAVALWGLSTPNFWLGIMLIMLFSVHLGWLPASGYVSPFEDLRANLAAMIMPAFVLGNAIAAVLMRHTRSAMLQVMSSDYVRTAREGPRRARRHPEARASTRDAHHHAGRARARHAPVRRGADGAGVHDPRLRQAHRRRGVQPRLRRRAGRRPLHGHRVHRAQPRGGRGVLPRQSQASRPLGEDRGHARC